MNQSIKKEFSPEDVADFLRENPDFFVDRQDVLEEMQIPGRSGKGVADFQHFMVERLRTDKAKAQSTAREVIENARANMTNQSKIQTAVLVLLEADSFEEFIQSVTQDLPALLDVDTVCLAIEAATKEIPFVNQSGFRFARPGTVEKWLGDGDALLQGNITGHEELFGPGAGLVRSQALIRLEISENTPFGILAFGARDPEAFHENMAVDQVGFLSQVVERCFRIWLGIQS